MKKKIITAVSTLTLISLLAGCFPSDKKNVSSNGDVDVGVNSNENSDSLTESEQPEQQTPDNLIWDMELSCDTPATVPSIRLTLKKWDKDEMEKILLDGKEIEEQFERDCQFYPSEKHYSYDTKDQQRIYFEPGLIVIDDMGELGGKYQYGLVDCEAGLCTASDDELTAFSREDAVNRVNALTDKLGITNYGEPMITPIKADFANDVLASYEGREDKHGNEYEYIPWTYNEEMYVLIYPFVYENTELAMNGFNIPQTTDKWSNTPSIIAVVTKDKIIRYCANCVYSAEYDTVENISVKYGFNNAVEDLNRFYSNLLLENPVTYYSGKLVYLPSEMTDDEMTVTFVPGWEFLGYTELWEKTSPFDRYPEYQYFYANTGFRYIEN